ncbi:MAG: c-type cytochrome biogenesis protein CcmI [Proteobacteria bacterium SG_bin9]|nr:MAG: c-type cytochrome biogenesis protein CcmI [Proteobacteria bacterium SG_bin9]
MALWFVLGLMTVAAAFAVLWPLSRGRSEATANNELAVYRHQLAEVDRDTAAGLVSERDAEAARVEISRRMIAASETAPVVSSSINMRARRAVAIVALAGLPLVAAGVYLAIGSPSLGDFPLAERQRATDVATASLERLVAQVEAHLEKNPSDARGWEVLAPVLFKQGRFDDAARAFRNIITHKGENAARRADLGEALSAAAGGVISTDAKNEFERAVALDPTEVKSRYFLGVAADQDGRPADARKIWQDMLASAPADAPWRPLVQAALEQTGGAVAANNNSGVAPGPTAEDVAAARDLNETDRNAMVRGMVDRLATRLKQDGNDVQGWLRLVRAYMVLGEADTARQAISDARRVFEKDDARLRELNDGVKQLGIGG